MTGTGKRAGNRCKAKTEVRVAGGHAASALVVLLLICHGCRLGGTAVRLSLEFVWPKRSTPPAMTAEVASKSRKAANISVISASCHGLADLNRTAVDQVRGIGSTAATITHQSG